MTTIAPAIGTTTIVAAETVLVAQSLIAALAKAGKWNGKIVHVLNMNSNLYETQANVDTMDVSGGLKAAEKSMEKYRKYTGEATRLFNTLDVGMQLVFKTQVMTLTGRITEIEAQISSLKKQVVCAQDINALSQAIEDLDVSDTKEEANEHLTTIRGLMTKLLGAYDALDDRSHLKSDIYDALLELRYDASGIMEKLKQTVDGMPPLLSSDVESLPQLPIFPYLEDVVPMTEADLAELFSGATAAEATRDVERTNSVAGKVLATTSV